MSIKDTTTIRRAIHGEGNPYFMMHRATAQDKQLSYEARGMLAYFLSKPDDWSVQVHDLLLIKKGGRDKIYSIINELVEQSYLEKPTKYQGDNGRWQWTDYIVHERPCTGKPYTDKPYTENPEIKALKTDNRIQSTGVKEPIPSAPEANAIVTAYMDSFPDNAQPVITTQDQKNAVKIAAAGYTPDEVKIATVAGIEKKGGAYPFKWMMDDLPSIRNVAKTTVESKEVTFDD